MIQLMPDAAAIELVQARQAQAQSPAQGIAAQWSAAQIGAPPTGLATVAAANPMPGLAGGMGGIDAPPMSAGPLPMNTPEAAEEQSDEGWNWGGAASGALGGLSATASTGNPYAIVAGTLGMGILGGLSDG